MNPTALKITNACNAAALVALLSLAAPAWSAPDFLKGEASRTSPRAKSIEEAPLAVPTDTPLVSLAPLPARVGKAMAEDVTSSKEGASLIGVSRSVPPDEWRAAAQGLRWTRTSGGDWSTVVTVRSAGAAALRVGIAVRGETAGVMLRFGGERTVGPIAGAEAATATRERGAFWGPVIDGEAQHIEIRVPGTRTPSAGLVSIEAVSHLFAGTGTKFEKSGGAKSAGGCNEDVACVGAPSQAFLNASRSVAKLVYTVDGATYSCSGTLVNDADAATQVPYILTAKHCIDSQEAASSLNTFWFFEASACGSKSSRETVQLTGGARLLYAGSVSDVALLRLKDAAPAGAWFSGIDPAALSPSEGTMSIHHPSGDVKKFSSGLVVNPAEGSTGRLTSVAWLTGTTEAGSSGAGLFSLRGNEYVVRGTLRGGSASCSSSGSVSDPSNRDYYSRLDLDFEAIRAFLLAKAAPLEDYTDLWISASEAGAGLSITQHASNTLYAVWFTYDAAGSPTWLVVPGGEWTTSTTYTGKVYLAQRPGSAAAVREVGTATLTFSDRGHGQLAYSLEGALRSLPIERQAF